MILAPRSIEKRLSCIGAPKKIKKNITRNSGGRSRWPLSIYLPGAKNFSIDLYKSQQNDRLRKKRQ